MARARNKSKGWNGQLAQTTLKALIETLKETIFSPEGTPMATIKSDTGQFSNKPLVAGMEFALSDIYVGKRGEPIFCFAPVDAQNFTIEVPLSKIDATFPTFCGSITEREDLGGETTEEILLAIINEASTRQEEQKVASKEDDLERKKAHYARMNNPNFGRF